jgi:hypothetical protein
MVYLISNNPGLEFILPPANETTVKIFQGLGILISYLINL